MITDRQELYWVMYGVRIYGTRDYDRFLNEMEGVDADMAALVRRDVWICHEALRLDGIQTGDWGRYKRFKINENKYGL